MNKDILQNLKLTKKEEAIMMVLWNAKKSLTITAIVEHSKTLGINLNPYTTQVGISRLLKIGIVQVAEITQVNKVLARTFEPAISPEQLAVLKFRQAINPLGEAPISSLFAALLDHSKLSEADIQELSDMIENMKRK